MDMKAVFIADAHLKRACDGNYRQLVEFLHALLPLRPSSVPVVTDVFLLGDIFDFWFSREDWIYHEYDEIVGILTDLGKMGVRVHLFEGNHDFFLGDYFATMPGVYVYPDWMTFEGDGRKMLMGHGDLVDEGNKSYLRFRQFLRSRPVYALQRVLPLFFLCSLARWSSSLSKEYMDGADEAIFAKMEVFALEKFREGYDDVILGHCHRPYIGTYEIGGRLKHFVTLGDWVRHFSFVSYENQRFSIEYQTGKVASNLLDNGVNLC